MQTKVVNFIMDNIKKNCSYNDTKLLEIKYGIETLYLTITKSIVTFGQRSWRRRKPGNR